jgi:large subunit ribosomal protein L19
MSRAAELMRSLESVEPNPNIPQLRPGDTVKVYNRIVEGDRERIQVIQGVVMRLRGGGINTSFTVRRIAAHGIGVERTFLLNSPRIEKVEVLRHAHVRRARLYYLRKRRGKAARLRERRISTP